MTPRKPVQARKRNIILNIGSVTAWTADELRSAKKQLGKDGRPVRFFILHDNKKPTPSQKKMLEFFDKELICNFSSPKSIVESLQSYEKELLAVTCRAEGQILNFAKAVPHLSYLKVPTSESLEWSVNKLDMRRRFKAYDPKITPIYSVAEDASEQTLNKIETKVGYPMVIKPVGLAQSLLVTVVYHREELERNLKRVFRQIEKVYREQKKMGERLVLVEQFLEGSQYSIDAYVNSKGKIYFCPPVHVKTGKEIGFDDFFGYRQLTPTQLSKQSIEGAQDVTTKAIHALGLKSCTAHVEILKTEQGWKVIEVGPRIGGFRHILYDLSYGFNHAANDVSIRIPKKPMIKNKVRGYSVALKFFAHKEGTISAIKGIKKAESLESFVRFIKDPKKIGERVKFAKNGGSSVFNIILFNESRSKLLADIRRLEDLVKIEVV